MMLDFLNVENDAWFLHHSHTGGKKRIRWNQHSLTHVDKHMLDRLSVTKEIVKESKAVDVETIAVLLYIFFIIQAVVFPL